MLATHKQIQYRAETAVRPIPEFVLIGRTNVGKSKLINHLLRTKNLAASSRKPGKTTEIGLYRVNDSFCLADTPGYSTSDNHVHERWQSEWRPLVETYLASTPFVTTAFFLFNVAKDVHPIDQEIVKMLSDYQISSLLVLTKSDQVASNSHREDRIRAIRKDLAWPDSMPHLRYTSHVAKTNMKNQKRARIDLQRFISAAMEHHTREQAHEFLLRLGEAETEAAAAAKNEAKKRRRGRVDAARSAPQGR